jgi:transcription-repair coupling factor (superfamily II helicase)
MLAALVCEKLNRPILYICPHIDDADKVADDILTFGGKSVETLPAWEGQIDIADATDEIRSERLRVALKLLSGQNNLVIPASIQAICQPIPKPQALAQSRLGLNINQQMSPEQTVGWLVDNSFEEVEQIDLPGQFARRGAPHGRHDLLRLGLLLHGCLQSAGLCLQVRD